MANETDDKVLKRFNAHFGESRPLSWRVQVSVLNPNLEICNAY